VSADLVIPARFNGPARSANGGFASGSLAERVPDSGRDLLGRTVEVTLRRPPPLERVLTVSHLGGVTVLQDRDSGTVDAGSRTVAEARPVEPDLPPVEQVDPDVAAEAMLGYPGRAGHPFPTCFACGPARAAGDGLRIFPGPVGGERGFVASTWAPQPSNGESSDLLDAVQRCGFATTWAALDCVGGWSEDIAGRPCVLGRMTARVDALPVVGEPHVVVGRHLGREGRKSFTASTLYDADGRIVACARHTWVQVDPAVFT
jgi:hypothetical protein